MSETTRNTKHVTIVTSPKAGTGAGREQIPELVTRLEQNQIDVLTTTSIDELQAHLADKPPNECAVVAAGGDGTVALVAENITPQIPLVPMPFGTENLLAKYFGHQSRAQSALETILHGDEKQIDAGRANGRLFLVMISCGFDASVVRDVDLRRKGHISRLSYAWPILKAVCRYRFPEMQIRIFDPKQPTAATDPVRARWAMVFNLPKYAGGLNIEPEASGEDEELNVISLLNSGFFHGIKYWFGVGTGRHLGWADVFRKRVGQPLEIEITSQHRVHYQIDGDYAGRLPVKIQVLPKRIRLICPPSTPHSV